MIFPSREEAFPAASGVFGGMAIHEKSVPLVTQDIIRRLVAAVRQGDDESVRTVLERLSEVADTSALLLLGERLNEDLEPRRLRGAEGTGDVSPV
ncbi:hypothetical protein ACFVYR_00040 [Streptomyces sp. NPDC058284]|uniref:hypothetical protein n=1 Tax=unclassified Streptomyces TaxID=2593676 RepID=UPI00365C8D11